MDLAVGFKRCCMKRGRYDGTQRNYYFQRPKIMKISSGRNLARC